MASTLVIAEVIKGKVASQTLATVSAALKLGGNVSLLVYGSGSEVAAKAASAVKGVAQVIHAPDANLDHSMAENLTESLLKLQAKKKFTHILASATNEGKNVIPRLAAKLDVSPISDVIGINSADTFVRPMYAGSTIATVKAGDALKIMTVRPTAFEKASATGGSAPVETFSESSKAGQSATWVKDEVAKSDRPELTSASKVVAGGRGLKSAENFKILYDLADKMGAAMGASRAAVDAGYVPNELQVGQTGKVVAPDLYIAVGISGAIQHLAGMKDSKTIACINKDPEAPIFLVSDFGLQADLFTAVPELSKLVEKKN